MRDDQVSGEYTLVIRNNVLWRDERAYEAGKAGSLSQLWKPKISFPFAVDVKIMHEAVDYVTWDLPLTAETQHLESRRPPPPQSFVTPWLSRRN